MINKRKSDFQIKNFAALHRSFDGEQTETDSRRVDVLRVHHSKEVAEVFQRLNGLRTMLRGWLAQEINSKANPSWDFWAQLEPELRKIDRDREFKKERNILTRLFSRLTVADDFRSFPLQSKLFGGFVAAVLLIGLAFQFVPVGISSSAKPLIVARDSQGDATKFQIANQLYVSSAERAASFETNSLPNRGNESLTKGNEQLELVSDNSNFTFDSLRTFPAQNRHFQVDWMRSRKPISIMPAKRENAPPIIWVRNSR